MSLRVHKTALKFGVYIHSTTLLLKQILPRRSRHACISLLICPLTHACRFVNNPDEQLASSSRYMVDLYLNSKRQVLLAVMSSLKINSQKHEGAVRRACSCKKQWLTRHWLLRVSAGPDHRINPYLTLTVWSMHSVYSPGGGCYY